MFFVFKRLDNDEFLHLAVRNELTQAAQLVEDLKAYWPGQYVVCDSEENDAFIQLPKHRVPPCPFTISINPSMSKDPASVPGIRCNLPINKRGVHRSDASGQRLLEALLDSWNRNNTCRPGPRP